MQLFAGAVTLKVEFSLKKLMINYFGLLFDFTMHGIVHFLMDSHMKYL